MSRLLGALLGGATFSEALQASGQAVHAVGARGHRAFRVTRHGRAVSMPLYEAITGAPHAANAPPAANPVVRT
jgi:hypothetical protein